MEGTRKMDIFDKLAQAREHKRVSWAEWAKLSGLSEMGLRKMFKNRSLSVDNMEKLCASLGLSPRDIYKDIQLESVLEEPHSPYGDVISKIDRIESLLKSVRQDLTT